MTTCKCCKDCTKRKVNCHAWCEEYIEWQKEHNRLLEEKHRQKEEEVNSCLGKVLAKNIWLKKRLRKLRR